jgi:hypothetical protein
MPEKQPNIVEGRPDFVDRKFGVTVAKRHAKYVYSNLNGLLLHKVNKVELHWYDARMDHLVRRDVPHVSITTVCGQMFFGSSSRGGKALRRSTMCELPKPDAVLCGRCHGETPPFGKDGKPPCTKGEAKVRLGCITEVA